MNESILLKIQSEITNKLVAENPDEEIIIFSRTKGDTESDIQNSLLSLAQGIAVMQASCEKILPNIIRNLVFEKVAIEIHIVSGTSMSPKYDAFQLAEWTCQILNNFKIPNTDAICAIENILPCVVTDSSGEAIDGASGVIVGITLNNVTVPRIS